MKRLALLWTIAWLWLSIPAHATTASITATITVYSSITFSPTYLAFGTHQIGSPVTDLLTVTNGGTQTFNAAVSLTGPQASDFSFSSQCNGGVAVGASCQISVTFSPTVAESDSAAITVAGSGRSYSAQLSGTGSSAPPPPPPPAPPPPPPPGPTPVSIALNPAAIQIYDDATGGSVVSIATVTMSDGSTNFTGTLTTSDTHYYTISGLNIVLAHGLSSADDGAHNTVIGIGP